MLKNLLNDYALPVAATLTLSVGGVAVNNRIDVAVLKSENRTLVQSQAEIVIEQRAILKELRDMNIIVTRIDTTLKMQEDTHVK